MAFHVSYGGFNDTINTKTFNYTINIFFSYLKLNINYELKFDGFIFLHEFNTYKFELISFILKKIQNS